MEARFEKSDSAFDRILGESPKVDHLATGFGFTEGPVWRGDHLLFSDIPNNRIVRYSMSEEGPHISTYRYPCGNTNGHTLDREDNLVSCEHANRRVSRTQNDRVVVAVAARYNGKRLNSPNDVVVKSDGSIYFTDPPYGLPGQSQGKELDFNGVYRVSPDGALTLLVSDMERPNGLAFSPDESRLYVADSARFHLRAFNVSSDGALTGGDVFAKMEDKEARGVPDGMKVDADGNVFATGPGGVWVFSPRGKQLGRILMPEVTANCAWGGSDWRDLYMTATTSLYRIRL
ncbi:MAG: SMP-30/gluconolactonase/LRE family protein, partial [Chloroflexi bacterium]|nr:SMP-30/gluconolactonase/LRE family protein [Chloroflexota bacterium]